MAILNQKRILNLIPKVSAPVTIHVSQGDVGTQIEFTLVKGDEVFSNTGNLTASVHGVRNDRANFGPFTCTLSGSKVTFPLHSEMTAVKGSALAEIVLVDNNGNKVGSANFGILVEESVFPLGVTYDNDVSVYESILTYVQTIPAQVVEDYTSKINAVQSGLNNEIATRISADALINTRIDEIIAPTGEAPNPAEIVDARIGSDNKTYSTLGDAIRSQISVGRDEIFEAANNIYTILDMSDVPWTVGSKIISNGSTQSDSVCSYCQYIYCKRGSFIHINSGYEFNVARYSKPLQSDFIDYRTYDTTDYIVPSDCYIRMTIRNLDGVTPVPEVDAQGAYTKSYLYSITSINVLKCKYIDLYNFDIDLEAGTLSSANGTETAATNRMRSATGVFIKAGSTIVNPDSLPIGWRRYNDAACTDYAAGSDFISTNIPLNEDGYYRFVFQFNNFMNGKLINYISTNDIETEMINNRVDALESKVKPLSEYPIICPPSSPYVYSGANITEQFVNGSGNMLTPLYALFDALITDYPGHVSSEVIGRDASNTYDIKAYTIGEFTSNANLPIILWLDDIHASEPYSLTATYQMCKELLENHDNDETLSLIWRTCTLKVVPVCNPWGLANGGSRYNSNGINLNRDFPVDWEYSDDPYDKTGTTPASQTETQAIMNYVSSLKSRTLFAVNKHDSSEYPNATHKIAYTVDNFKIDLNVLRALYRMEHTEFISKYEWIVTGKASTDYTTLFSNLSTTETHGTMHKWFNYIGIHGGLCEVCRPKPNTYTEDKEQDFIQINLELSVNMIAAMLQSNRLLISEQSQYNKYDYVN